MSGQASFGTPYAVFTGRWQPFQIIICPNDNHQRLKGAAVKLTEHDAPKRDLRGVLQRQL
ncbi:hypothetical protein D3C85_1914740 [compost metagenome]